MRKYLYTALFCALSVMLLSGCGGGKPASGSSETASTGSGSDKLFGDVSGVVVEYAQKQNDFQKEAVAKMAKIKSMEDATKLEKKATDLKKEAESKLEEAAKELIGKKVPYEESEGLFFKITSDPVITKASANGSEAVSIDITYRAAQKEAMEIAKMAYFDYPICYQLVDATGAPLWTSMTYINAANPGPVKFEAGQDYGQDFVMKFSITEKNADKLKDAIKLVFISKAQYDAAKK